MATGSNQQPNADIPKLKYTIKFVPENYAVNYDDNKVANYCVLPEQSLINQPIFECSSPPNDEAVGGGCVEVGRRKWRSLGNDARWNLNEDFEHWEKPGLFDYTKSFYKWICDGDESRVNLVHAADIVCNNNLLTWMIPTKDKPEYWNVKIVRLPKSNTLLFYEECTTNFQFIPTNNQTMEETAESERRCLYYGINFEFIMTGFSWRKSERRRFVNVVNGQLNDLKILVYGKVDATFSTSNLDGSRKDIEFRTRTMRSREKQHYWEINKSCNWWSSCFFLGTSTIVVGYYDEEGHVKSVEEMPAKEINGGSNGKWSKDECLSLLYQILSKIKEVAESVLDDPKKVLVCRNTTNKRWKRGEELELSFEVCGSDSSHYSAIENNYGESLNNLRNI